MTRTFALAAWAGFIFIGWAAPQRLPAEEPQPSASQQSQDPADEGPLSADQIALFCEQLGAAEFDAREEATKQLIARGKAGVNQVAAAAEAGGLEVAMRAVRILGEFFRLPDATATAAAGTALAKLSESKNRSVARRAGNILRPPDTAATQQALIGRANRRVVGGIAVNVVGNQIIAGGGMRVRTINNNGDVTIEAEEGGRKVVITHRNAQNIVVRVTEPPAAGEKAGKTTEYKAKDLEELKAKHPEAYVVFEKYGGGQRGTIRMNLLPAIVPLPPVPIPPR